VIVIPMAGLSRRFSVAGYTKPKYMLPIKNDTVFTRAISSFEAQFKFEKFLFIARPILDTENFLRKECYNLGITNAQIVMLEHDTAGQAETVEQGLQKVGIDGHEPITIFNIDTFRRDFQYPRQAWFLNSSGYLEVFYGSGSNWSYVKALTPSDEPLVEQTVEKQPVSNLCSNGLYHFAKTDDFLLALACERLQPSMPELYVAPLYNHLIAVGKHVHYFVVPLEVITFCGIPKEYEALVAATI